MSEMTITPDLYLEGDSKQWKKRQAIYLDIMVIVSRNSMISRYFDTTRIVVSTFYNHYDSIFFRICKHHLRSKKRS
jgi:hypothetical protein